MKKYYLLVFLFFSGWILSGIYPRNFSHWIGESLAPLIGFILLAKGFKRFRYSLFTYWAILFACLLMFVGAHYTFSRVPMPDWTYDAIGNRNNFDKIGHFVQGIVPVLITRELFIRKKIMTQYGWISFISFCICLSTTSVYEIVEFLVCSLAGRNPDTFLGTQGYIWDSQSDMLFAVLGGLFTLFFLRKAHDHILEKEFPGSFDGIFSKKNPATSAIKQG
ncbi:MAG: DUF2238 domain-containing protein [Marinilabiliales bacterium]|nr:DUF2238 domain-containing protein [Marinilabiliales bacterium]